MKNSMLEHTDSLQQINQKMIAEGETLPVVKLKDGSKVQTGTVATMLYNIGLYNAGMRGQLEEELVLSIPTLLKVGLFDLFPPNAWIEGDNPGRRFVGHKAQEYINKLAQTEP